MQIRVCSNTGIKRVAHVISRTIGIFRSVGVARVAPEYVIYHRIVGGQRKGETPVSQSPR